jgi:hypothetical protein
MELSKVKKLSSSERRALRLELRNANKERKLQQLREAMASLESSPTLHVEEAAKEAAEAQMRMERITRFQHLDATQRHHAIRAWVRRVAMHVWSCRGAKTEWPDLFDSAPLGCSGTDWWHVLEQKEFRCSCKKEHDEEATHTGFQVLSKIWRREMMQLSTKAFREVFLPQWMDVLGGAADCFDPRLVWVLLTTWDGYNVVQNTSLPKKHPFVTPLAEWVCKRLFKTSIKKTDAQMDAWMETNLWSVLFSQSPAKDQAAAMDPWHVNDQKDEDDRHHEAPLELFRGRGTDAVDYFCTDSWGNVTYSKESLVQQWTKRDASHPLHQHSGLLHDVLHCMIQNLKKENVITKEKQVAAKLFCWYVRKNFPFSNVSFMDVFEHGLPHCLQAQKLMSLLLLCPMDAPARAFYEWGAEFAKRTKNQKWHAHVKQQMWSFFGLNKLAQEMTPTWLSLDKLKKMNRVIVEHDTQLLRRLRGDKRVVCGRPQRGTQYHVLQYTTWMERMRDVWPELFEAQETWMLNKTWFDGGVFWHVEEYMGWDWSHLTKENNGEHGEDHDAALRHGKSYVKVYRSNHVWEVRDVQCAVFEFRGWVDKVWRPSGLEKQTAQAAVVLQMHVPDQYVWIDRQVWTFQVQAGESIFDMVSWGDDDRCWCNPVYLLTSDHREEEHVIWKEGAATSQECLLRAPLATLKEGDADLSDSEDEVMCGGGGRGGGSLYFNPSFLLKRLSREQQVKILEHVMSYPYALDKMMDVHIAT